MLAHGASATRMATGVFVGRPRASPDGRRWVYAVVEGQRSHLRLLEENGAARDLTDGVANDRDPAFAPDGTRIVFASDRAGSFDLWLLDLQNGSLSQLTSFPGNEFEPDWSPWPVDVVVERVGGGSGRVPLRHVAQYHRIAFAAREPGTCWIGMVSSDGVAHARLTASSKGECGSPRWTPDGGGLAYEMDGGVQLAALYHHPSDDDQSALLEASWPAIAGNLQHRLEPQGSWAGVARPSFAPNGVWLLAHRQTAEGSRVVALRRSGRGEVELAQGGSILAEPTSQGDVGFVVGTGHERTLYKARLSLPLPSVTNLWSYPELDRIDASHLLAREQFAVLEQPLRTMEEAAGRALDAPGDGDRNPWARGLLITTDAVTELVQIAFSHAMELADRDALAPRLRSVLASLHHGASTSKDGMRNEDRQLSILTGIALSLLATDGPGWSAGVAPTVHPGVRVDVEQALRKLVPTGKRVAFRELGIESLDPTELKPRGFYDKNSLRGYFRAMTWLARAHLRPGTALRAYELLKAKGAWWEYERLLRTHRALLGQPEDADLTWFSEIEIEHGEWFNGDRDRVVQRVGDRLAGTPSRLLASTAGAFQFNQRSRHLPPLSSWPSADVPHHEGFSA